MWSPVAGFFQLAPCPQGSSTWQYLTESPSFLRWNNVPLHGWTAFCLFIHQSMGIWVVSTFRLPWILLVWLLVSRFLWGPVFSSLGHVPRTLIAGRVVAPWLIAVEPPGCSPRQPLQTSLPPAGHRGSPASPPSPTLVVIWVFDSSHPSGCVVVSHWVKFLVFFFF